MNPQRINRMDPRAGRYGHAPCRSRRCAALLIACFVGVCSGVGCNDPDAPKNTPPPTVWPASPDSVVALLESSYRERNHADFTRILANAPDQGVGFVFFVATLPPGSLWWDFDEESRIHRRMFGRGDFEPGEQEVPPQFWLDAINISLHRVTEWTERPELYRSATNPNGLPPEKWKVIDARFSTFVFFDTQTDQDFLVEGEAIFTVIEDLEKSGAEPGHFLLLQWQDVDPNGQHEKEAKTWSVIKYLYK